MGRELVKLIAPTAVEAEVLAHGLAGARRQLARFDSFLVMFERDTVCHNVAKIVDELDPLIVFLALKQLLDNKVRADS